MGEVAIYTTPLPLPFTLRLMPNGREVVWPMLTPTGKHFMCPTTTDYGVA